MTSKPISATSAELPTSPQTITAEAAPYWEAAAQGRLLLPVCGPCDAAFWYPRGFCPDCGSAEIRWIESTGTGTVYSFTAVHRSSGEWAERTPYYVAYVTLEEGITLAANLIGVQDSSVRIGMRVTAVFERREPEDSPILRFRPTS